MMEEFQCRICLDGVEQNFLSLNTESSIKNKTYLELYEFLLGSTPNVTGPNYFCSRCAENVIHYYNFKKKCVESELLYGNLIILKKEVDLEDILDISVEESEAPTKNCDGNQYKHETTNLLSVIKIEEKATNETSTKAYAQQKLPKNKRPNATSNNTSETYKCPYCSTAFYSKVKLTQHCVKVHPNDRFQCSDCSETFHLVTALNVHRRIKHELSVCCHCGKQVAARYMTTHIKNLHINGGIRICDICGAQFLHRSSILKHMRLKHLNFTYNCCYCGKTFKTDSANRKHQLKYHLKRYKYKCKRCPNAYESSAKLKAHACIHSIERNFICDTCGLRVSTKYTLRRHQAVHSELRPFICEICSMSYKTKKALYVHKRIHGERNYECPVCSQNYISNQQMRLHCTKVHPDYKLPPPGTLMNKNAIKRHLEINEKYNVDYELPVRMPKTDFEDRMK